MNTHTRLSNTTTAVDADTPATSVKGKATLSRSLVRALLVMAAALAAVLSLSAPSHAISQVDDQVTYSDLSAFAVDYQGTRTVTVAAWIQDRPGDAYCTYATVDIRTANGETIGQRVTLGAVCGGRYGVVERTITVTRDIGLVGNTIGSYSSWCVRASDYGHQCQ